MKLVSTSLLAGLAGLALVPLAPVAQAAAVYALTADNGSLVRFDTSTPSVVSTVALSGATLSLDGIDFRPANDLLYGYSASGSGIYTLNPLTGVTTLVSTSTSPVTSPLGIDFNPAADRLRVVDLNDANRRINVDTGAALNDGALAYNAGDVNAGVNPNIIEAAYTNNDVNPATGTVLYYFDSALDTLVTTAAPNAGVLDTVGALGFDIDEFTGFDIFTSAQGVNTAFASFFVGGVQGLYNINLASGAASLLGVIGDGSALSGLAISTAEVPEPGTLGLLAAAGLAAAAMRRRRPVGLATA